MPLPPLPLLGRLKKIIGRSRVRLLHEKDRPFRRGLLAALVAWVAFPATFVDKLTVDVLPTAVTVAAILAGLMSTAQSILLALIDKPVIAYLKAEKHYDTLIDYQRASFRTQLWFIAASLLVMVLRADGFHPPLYTRLVPAALAFLWVWAWSSTSRQMELMFKLLRKKDASA